MDRHTGGGERGGEQEEFQKAATSNYDEDVDETLEPDAQGPDEHLNDWLSDAEDELVLHQLI